MAQVEVSGTIKDENGEPFVGANVVEEGTTNGTLTDINGAYTLTVSEGSTVIISSVGYKTITIIQGEATTFSFSLEKDIIGLDQVVVSASKRRERILDAPASVSVIGTQEIENTVGSLTVTDNLKKTPGVDIMQTGLVSANVNLRGFNNIFSGAMLTMVDNRIARVPSLRVNAYQLIPVNTTDIEKIEIVRGPASALYGPNAADGVMHIITKSPLDQAEKFETTVSMLAGTRSVWNPEIRHSGKLSEKFAYKISGSYMQGHDWPYFDPREPREGTIVAFGSVQDGGDWVQDTTIAPRPHRRDFFIQKYNTDLRFDIAPSKDMDIIVQTGFARTNNLELTGLGAGQGRDWTNYYGQAKFRYKRFFAQYFINGSNAGDTYLIPQSPTDTSFQLLIDKSKLHVIQLQQSHLLANNSLEVIYGFDALLTRPNTEGTINGRFEDDDNINQLGIYGQADWDITEKWKLLGALRIDYMDQIEEIQFSPRASLAFRPSKRHTIRATYNRAFSSPTSLNLSLDLANGFSPAGYAVRGIGNPSGYTYSFNETNNQIQYLSHYDGSNTTYYDYNNTANNYQWFDAQLSIVAAGLAESAGFDPALVEAILNSLLVGIGGDTGTIQNTSHLGVELIGILEGNNPYDVEFDPTTVSDLGSVESTVTQTWEIGYKGIIKDKLFLSADLYYTKIQNFISPLTNIIPSVIFDPIELQGALENPSEGVSLQQNLANSGLDPLLSGLLDGNPAYGNGGVANGTAYDELIFTIQGANAQLGFGNVSPTEEITNNDVLLTYVNLGTIDVMGMDIGFTYQVNEKIALTGAGSFVNKDRIPLEGAAGGFVALNAPKWKASVAFDHTFPDIGFSYGVNWRWQDAFPANSAVYVGDVFPANLVDIRLNYRPNWSKGTHFGLDFQNIFNNEWQRFPGTPFMGFMMYAKVAHTF